MHLRISLALRPIHNTQLQLILPVAGMMGKNQAHSSLKITGVGELCECVLDLHMYNITQVVSTLIAIVLGKSCV
jgi:hypothetical protein